MFTGNTELINASIIYFPLLKAFLAQSQLIWIFDTTGGKKLDIPVQEEETCFGFSDKHQR